MRGWEMDARILDQVVMLSQPKALREAAWMNDEVQAWLGKTRTLWHVLVALPYISSTQASVTGVMHDQNSQTTPHLGLQQPALSPWARAARGG